MHILIIPGEELNVCNIHSSVFELDQAKALTRHHNFQCGFISIQLKGNFFAQLQNLLKFKLSIIDVLKFFKTKKLNIEKIESFNCVEAVSYYVWAGKFKTKYDEQVNVGLRAYNMYVQKFGTPDLIHAHSRFLTGGLIAYEIYKKYKIPYLLTEHSSFYARNSLTPLENQLVQSIINHASYWICVSKTLGDLVSKTIEKLNKNFLCIPNVIDTNFENINPSKVDYVSGKFKFIHIASLIEIKAQHILIKAFASKFKGNNDYQLFIAGSGPLENSLKALTKQLGVEEQTFFLGQLSRNEIKEYLQQSNAFVLSSIYETFGVVLIEALACGLPVIATACGGPESIINEENGYLVETNNINDLGNAMWKMAENYHSFDSIEIRKNCLANFGSKNFADKMQELYHSISTHQ